AHTPRLALPVWITWPSPETHMLVWIARMAYTAQFGLAIRSHLAITLLCLAHSLAFVITRPCHRKRPATRATTRLCGIDNMVFGFCQNLIFYISGYTPGVDSLRKHS
ncbi:hypothetical protein J1N35_022998, partial [Gossypium stocksii]